MLLFGYHTSSRKVKVLSYKYAFTGKRDYGEICIALALESERTVWRPRSAFTNSVASGKLLNFYKPQFSCMKNGIIIPQGCSED